MSNLRTLPPLPADAPVFKTMIDDPFAPEVGSEVVLAGPWESDGKGGLRALFQWEDRTGILWRDEVCPLTPEARRLYPNGSECAAVWRQTVRR